MAQTQNQKFAIGTTYAAIVTPAVAGFIAGENGTHSVDRTVSGIPFTGEDAQFVPSVSGQSVTITFGAEVQDVWFTLFDIDASAQFTITAMDALSFPRVLSANFHSSTSLVDYDGTMVPTNNTSSLILASSTTSNVVENMNDGSATIFISGNVKQITITINQVGTNAQFWLSDITACVTGSFPINYHQIAGNRPYTGQPDYFISTPDNAYSYMVGLDAFTAGTNYVATRLFFDSTRFVNSLAYDGVNRILYYVLDATIAGTQNPNNKQLKKYDFNTETSSMVVADLSWLGIPTFEAGVESAGACFYDGALYLGIEGGHHDDDPGSGTTYTSTREAVIYKIEFDASLNPVNTYQVYSLNHYDPAAWTNSYNDWGDFIIKDGILYNFNTARQGSGPVTYPNSAIHKFDLMTGAATRVANPTPASPYIGQVGIDWAGNIYSVRTGVQLYNPATNALGTNRTIAAASGSVSFPIPQGAGDASEPFRPKVDVGDAPDSYDPDPLAPALHDFAENTVRLGATIDREWVKTPSVNANTDGADEDGVPTVFVYNNGTNYTVGVNVFNNPVTFTTATLCAWLDFNQNGTFEVTEGITRTINKVNALQSISLTWPSATFPLPNNTMTYLRIRIASNYSDLTKRLTTAKPTGYMPNGEVEDYYVLTSIYPLPLNRFEFNVQKKPNRVQLDWNHEEDGKIDRYLVTRSANGQSFEPVVVVKANNGKKYSAMDPTPLEGTSYYRIEAVDKAGKTEFGPMKSISFESATGLNVHPNPSFAAARIEVVGAPEGKAILTIFNTTGLPVQVQMVELRRGRNTIPLNTQQLPAGSYFIEVRANLYTERTKLVIRK